MKLYRKTFSQQQSPFKSWKIISLLDSLMPKRLPSWRQEPQIQKGISPWQRRSCPPLSAAPAGGSGAPTQRAGTPPSRTVLEGPPTPCCLPPSRFWCIMKVGAPGAPGARSSSTMPPCPLLGSGSWCRREDGCCGQDGRALAAGQN